MIYIGMSKYTNLRKVFLLFILISVVNCGIPGLHKWVINNFPSCVKIVEKNQLVDVDTYINKNNKIENTVNNGNDIIKNKGINKGINKEGNKESRYNNKVLDVDNLLFDLNQLLHKANVEFCSYNNYFFKLSNLIKNVLKKFHPKKNVVFAIDGICPFSKLKLQIKRRAKIKYKENKNIINDITCGSVFIEKIGQFLINFVKWLASLEKYANVKFYISTAKEVGEGELKLMNWITSYVKKDKKENNNDIENNELLKYSNYDKTDSKREEESFIVVGADADLLLQCLALKNIRNVYIYTYQTFYLNMDNDFLFKKEKQLIDKQGKNKDEEIVNETCYVGKENELTNSGKAINNLVNIKKIARKKIMVLYNLNIFINLFLNKYPIFFNQIKRDLLILFILKGNDYLPKVREGNFNVFFEAYFKMLEDNMKKEKKKINNVKNITYNGFLNKNCELNRKEFLKFLNYVQKVINFSSSYLSRNTEGNYLNLENNVEFKENQLYLPLYLVNEIIKKKIVENENIDMQIEKNNEELYKCTLVYLKNENKIKKYYYGVSKRKKIAMHIASSKFIENELPLFIKYIDFNLLKNTIKEVDRIDEINLEKLKMCVGENCNTDKEIRKLENFESTNKNEENSFSELEMNIFTKDDEKEDRKMEIYLKKFYTKNCKKKKNYEQEMKICENYIEGIKWLVEMYTKTYCINFNFFYKYSISPSLLSLYYYLCQHNVKTYNNDYTNIMQNINLNIFKNNSDYYKFINFCVNKYNDIKLKLKLEGYKGEANDKKETSNNEMINMEKASKESISFSSVKREKDNVCKHKKNINYDDNKYFENIYDILLSKNINVIKKSVEKLNEILRNFPKTKMIKYYWDMYAKKLKKFYKIIYYKSKKIFVAKVSLFNIEFETKFNSSTNLLSNNKTFSNSKKKIDNNKSLEELDKLDFNIKNNYIYSHNNLKRCNKKNNRLFSKTQNIDNNTNKFSKRVIKIKSMKLVYR
ncbi:conserved Plasmodium protein, unknown function [Plasmodium berghei]|uniref:Xrn1 N-terminal domain-containing protein n=1 Tax=Plasmodium berghei TaxID=5821 RepID=A0A1D3LTM0_PLABE|nr:conserved Plasmodium protein, unknown function [Plasmodium berghei]